MSKRTSSAGKIKGENNGHGNILNDEDFKQLTEKIIKDLESTKDDITEKVDYAKCLITATLRFYKKESADKVCSTFSENDIGATGSRRDGESGTAKKGGEVATSSKDEENDTSRKTRSFTYLIDKVGQELMKINDNTKALAASTKSAIRTYINRNLYQTKNESVKVEGKFVGKKCDNLGICDDKTKTLMEKITSAIRENDNASARQRKRSDKGSQSDKFITENLLIFETKLKGDPKMKKTNVDRIVKGIQKEINRFQSVNEMRKL